MTKSTNQETIAFYDVPYKERLVSLEEAAQIKSEIEAYFRKELLKVRTKQELLQDARGSSGGDPQHLREACWGGKNSRGAGARNPEPVRPGGPGEDLKVLSMRKSLQNPIRVARFPR